jgi:hypothetical protein
MNEFFQILPYGFVFVPFIVGFVFYSEIRDAGTEFYDPHTDSTYRVCTIFPYTEHAFSFTLR